MTCRISLRRRKLFSRRRAAKALHSAVGGQRLVRTGSHGHSSFWPGPRSPTSGYVRPSPPVKRVAVSLKVSEQTVATLEAMVRERGLEMGKLVDELVLRGSEREVGPEVVLRVEQAETQSGVPPVAPQRGPRQDCGNSFGQDMAAE